MNTINCIMNFPEPMAVPLRSPRWRTSLTDFKAEEIILSSHSDEELSTPSDEEEDKVTLELSGNELAKECKRVLVCGQHRPKSAQGF